MAKAFGSQLLSGRIHNLIYKVREGKQYVSMAPAHSDHKRRLRNKAKYPAYFQNLQEFAGASKIAAQIYQDLNTGFLQGEGPLFKPYAHNALAAVIKPSAFHERQTPEDFSEIGNTQFHLRHACKALRGLDLSHTDAPSQNVFFTPIGPMHNPEAIKITGLTAAADAIRSHGNAILQFRIHIRQSLYQEICYDDATKRWVPLEQGMHILDRGKRNKRGQPSDWIPAEIIPADGITIPLAPRTLDPSDKLPAHDHTKYITAIIIEWRELRPVGKKIHYLRKKAIIKIAAVHGPAEALAEAALPTSAPYPDPDSDPHLFEPVWQKDPIAYLKSALQQIRT